MEGSWDLLHIHRLSLDIKMAEAHVRVSEVTSGYTPLRGFQLLPLVIEIGDHILFLRPRSDSADSMLPYDFPPSHFRTRSDFGLLIPGSEGKRFLCHIPGRGRYAILYFLTLSSENARWDDRIVESRLPVPSYNSKSTFDEVSGRLFHFAANTIFIQDLY